MGKDKEKFLLKDHLVNREKIAYLANLIKNVDQSFPSKNFQLEILAQIPKLELKARLHLIADKIATYLPSDFKKSVTIILQSLPPVLDENNSDDDFGEFILIPFAEYIAKHGCHTRYLKISLPALKEITKRISVEFAIRPFLDKYPTETLDYFDKWVHDHNYHVRRLVCEGSRPSLPWAPKISLNYKIPLKYLDILFSDSTRYVTRSVANHLNDISKIDPDMVLATLKKWKKSNLQSKTEMNFIIKHALRTLIKKGNQSALQILGFETSPDIKVSRINVDKTQATLGEKVEFSFTIKSNQSLSLLLDYVIESPTKSGSSRQKVYKIKSVKIGAGEIVKINKIHHFKNDTTTFSLYPGTYRFILQINGRQYSTKELELNA